MSESADMTSSGEVDVLQLNWTDNPWKPRHMGTSNITDQETEAEEMYRKVRGMLNKMTVHKFTTFKDLMSTLPINGKKEMENVINLIYEKAVNEPMYSRVYAQMCKVLSVLLMPIQLKHRDDPQYSNFSELLLNCCHAKFEKDPEVELRREDWFKQIEAALDPLKKKELKASFEEEERRIRTRFVGNVRFMAEIFKLEMMEVTTMHCCIAYLIQGRDEISLECLCVLLTHVGSYMESKHEDLSLYFTVMKAICKNKGLVSNRLRFMLMDVIVLRHNKWIPHSNIQFAHKYTLRKRQQKIEKTALDGDGVQSFGDTVSITESDKLDSLSIQSEYECYSAIVHMYSMHMPEDKQIKNVDLPENWLEEEFFKMVYDTLNKKTIHKFTELVKQLNDHPPRNHRQLKGIVIIIYAKAMEEAIFSVAYAQLCRALSEIKVALQQKYRHTLGTTTFKELLVEYCESEARKNSRANLIGGIRMKEIEEFSHRATVKEEEEQMRRMKLLKLIKFIGDLYIVGILMRTTIDSHIHRLLNEKNEESLECLCILLATAGKDMDSNILDSYVNKIKKICNVDKKLPERIRLMLQDLIKLRQSWAPQSILYPEPWYQQQDGSTQESRSTMQSAKSKEVGGASVPSQKEEKMNPKEIKNDEELYKKVRSVLNKLMPQNFQTLVTQLCALPIDNSDRLKGVANLIVEKAVNEPNFSVAYAQMCKVLSGLQVPAERNNKDVPEYVNFRKLLINRCQMEFEKDKKEGLNREAKLREIEATTDPEKKKKLQHNLEEEERRIQMKSVGNVKFIGELFKLGMLSSNIMQRCIKHLLQDGSEDSLECLCALLTTIGKVLEYKNQDLSEYFETMKNISLKKDEVSNKIRFMLQDVIDLRNNKWIPRRDDSNSKSVAHWTPWGQVNRVPQKKENPQEGSIN